MTGVEPSMSVPLASSSGSNDNPSTDRSTVTNNLPGNGSLAHDSQMSCDLGASLEFNGGMMKIVPSDADVSLVVINLICWTDKNIILRFLQESK